MKIKWKKIMSWMLVVVMVVGICPDLRLTAKADTTDVASVIDTSYYNETKYDNINEAVDEWLATSSSTLKLLKDVEYDGTITVTSARWLDLNGYGFRFTGSKNNAFFVNGNTAELILKDSSSGKKHNYTLPDAGYGQAAVNDSATGSNVRSFYGGYITGGTGYGDSPHGGAVYVNNGTLVMNAGTFIGNKAQYGGAVYIEGDDAKLNLCGGDIIGNASSKSGGGLLAENNPDINMTGGTIKENMAGKFGGGMVLDSGTFIMSGGKISENYAGDNGGGIQSGVPIEMSDKPVIKDNHNSNGVNNLYFYRDQSIIIVNSLVNGADIGVRPRNLVFTSNYNKYNPDTPPGKYFKSDDANYIVTSDDSGEAKFETITQGNEYAWGVAMGTANITLVAPEKSAKSYLWQKADSKDGEYITFDVTTTNKCNISSSNLISGKWYRVVMGNKATIPVQALKATSYSTVSGTGDSKLDGTKFLKVYSSGQWYLTNGAIAYTVVSTSSGFTSFDVLGKYIKDGTTYWMNTSYSNGWQLKTSTESNPSAASASYGGAQLDELRFIFKKGDDNALLIDADLKEGQKAFCFGSDVMLGTNTVTRDGFNPDCAALALVEDETTHRKQVQMVGAKSPYMDSDPAFVLDYLDYNDVQQPSDVWLGSYSSRKAWTSNKQNESANIKVDSDHYVIQCLNMDSGMTTSWKNVPDGGIVKFGFSVGTCGDIGVAYILATDVNISGSDTVIAGKTISLSAKVIPNNSTSQTVEWTSSDTGIATVNSNGVVTGRSGGEVTITAKVTNASGAAPESVSKTKIVKVLTPLQYVDISGIAESGKTLTAAVAPQGAGATYQWYRDGAAISGATESTYTLTDADVGRTIRVTATGMNNYYGSVAASTGTIAPKTVRVLGIEIIGNDSVLKGQDITLTPVISPENATNKQVTWTSGNTNIAAVDANGIVTGKAAGTVTIAAKTQDGRLVAYKQITVITSNSLTGVSINGTEYGNAPVGTALTAKVTPSGASVDYEWKVGDAVVGANQPTYIPTADDAGKNITVTVIGKNGYTGSVTSHEVPVRIKVTGVSIWGNSKYRGELTAIVEPKDATVEYRWSGNSITENSIPNILSGQYSVTVTGTGNYYGTAVASVNINASLRIYYVNSILINGADSVQRGKTINLTANVEPADATNKKVIWTSGNEQIATVDANGKVTGLDTGKVTITAAAADERGVIATKDITVVKPSYNVTVNSYPGVGGMVTANEENFVVSDVYTEGDTATVKATANNGYYFVCWKEGDTQVSTQKSYTFTVGEDVTLTAVFNESQPKGSIIIATDRWASFWNTLTFERFFKEPKAVTINGIGKGSEIDGIYYYESDSIINDVSSITDNLWTELTPLADTQIGGEDAKTGSFTIDTEQKVIIYAKIVDEAGHKFYLNSDGIVLDGTKPEITGVENGKTYCLPQTVTVEDANLDKVTVNGTEVALGAGNTYTLAATDKAYTIVATDKAGNSTTVSVVVKNGHRFTNYQVVTPATCTADGEKKACCDNCGILDTKPIVATGHVEAAAVRENYAEPDCTTEGSYDSVVYCSVCGYKISTTNKTAAATGHKYEGENEGWITILAPTCQKEGFKKRTCTVCGAIETQGILATGHDFASDFSIDKAATCTTQGSKSKHCLRCEAVKDVTAIEKLAHTIVTDQRVEPTCTELGWTQGSHCSVCDTAIIPQVRIAALGHTGGTATCSEMATCETCHEKYGAIDTENHTYEAEFTIDIEASCTETGSKSKHCSDCNAKKDITEIPAKNHNFGDWEDIISSTCEDEGKKKRTCEACGYMETKNVDPLEHDWAESYTEDKAPTCKTEGSRSIHCLREGCGAVRDSEIIPKLGHTEVPVSGREVKCTQTGLTEGIKCSVCDIVIIPQKIIPEFGHSYGNWQSHDPYKHQKVCSICDNCVEKDHIMGNWTVADDEGKLERACSSCDYVEQKIRVSEGDMDTSVLIKPNTPELIIEGLDSLLSFDAIVEDGTKGITAADKAVVTDGGSVVIQFMAENIKDKVPAAEKDKLKSKADKDGKEIGLNLDLSLIKKVTDIAGNKDETKLTETNTPIKVVIPLEKEQQGKKNYVIYRYHDNDVDTITTDKSGEEYIEVAKDNTAITLFAKKFSTYVLAYDKEASADVPVDTPATTGPQDNPKPENPDATIEEDKTNLTPEQKEQAAEIVSNLGLTEEEAAEAIIFVTDNEIPRETFMITDKTIMSQKDDNDIPGSSFPRIQARADKLTPNTVRLKWNKVFGADGYEIYGNKCGKKNPYKFIKVIKNPGTITYTQKKLKKGAYYKYIVIAYKNIGQSKITIAASKTVHATTTGGKFGVAKAVKVNKKSITLREKKTFKIKASEIKKDKKIAHHRNICYESSNPKVATVSKNGVIKGIGKGTCDVFVYAQNGVYKRIKVKVK